MNDPNGPIFWKRQLPHVFPVQPERRRLGRHALEPRGQRRHDSLAASADRARADSGLGRRRRLLHRQRRRRPRHRDDSLHRCENRCRPIARRCATAITISAKRNASRPQRIRSSSPGKNGKRRLSSRRKIQASPDFAIHFSGADHMLPSWGAAVLRPYKTVVTRPTGGIWAWLLGFAMKAGTFSIRIGVKPFRVTLPYFYLLPLFTVCKGKKVATHTTFSSLPNYFPNSTCKFELLGIRTFAILGMTSRAKTHLVLPRGSIIRGAGHLRRCEVPPSQRVAASKCGIVKPT